MIIMDEKAIAQLCKECFEAKPEYVKRCAVGLANYVYIVECEHQKIIIRCSTEKDAYKNTIYWLGRLSQINVPVPEVLRSGEYRGYSYLILSYLEGRMETSTLTCTIPSGMKWSRGWSQVSGNTGWRRYRRSCSASNDKGRNAGDEEREV